MDIHLKFILNNEIIETIANSAEVVLDFIRGKKKLTGTKEGCREGDCGACAVLVGNKVNGQIKYKTFNSCLLPLLAVNGKHVVTIEGLNSKGLNLIQQAIVDEGATQCGFCTPGFIISFTSYFLNSEKYSYDELLEFLGGNICRCTGYSAIKRACRKTLSKLQKKNFIENVSLHNLVEADLLPEYFLSIPERLNEIKNDFSVTKLSGEVTLVAGGTDLFVQKPVDLLETNIVDIGERFDNQNIMVDNQYLIISAETTIDEFQNSFLIGKYLPQLKKQLSLFGSLPIRNRATLGGNIINASPIADAVNILLALDASLVFTDGINERQVKLDEFYLGYKKLNKSSKEILKTILVPIPKQGSKFNFEKISRRINLDIASVNSSIYLETESELIRNVRITAGGVAPIPLFLKKASDFLTSEKICFKSVDEAAEIALTEISPISDVRGSADYKRLLLRQLIFAHFIKLFRS